MAALPAVLCRRAVALVLALASVPSLAAAAARPLTETDMFRFTWVADPQISPDGRRVAFVRVTVNDKKDGYDTAIWTVDTEGGRASVPHRGATGPLATLVARRPAAWPSRARWRRQASRSRPSST